MGDLEKFDNQQNRPYDRYDRTSAELDFISLFSLILSSYISSGIASAAWKKITDQLSEHAEY